MGHRLDRKVILIILVVAVITQMVFLAVNIASFKENYEKDALENLFAIGCSLQRNLEDLLKKGVPIQQFFGLKSLLSEILDNAPELAFIAIRDNTDKILYYCDRNTFIEKEDASAGQRLSVGGSTIDENRLAFPLSGQDEKVDGRLIIGMDQDVIRAHVRALALDTGTVVLISILAILDLLFFTIAYTITLPFARAQEEISLAVKSNSFVFPIHRTGLAYFDRLLDAFDAYRRSAETTWHLLSNSWKELKGWLKRNGGTADRLWEVVRQGEKIIAGFRDGSSVSSHEVRTTSPALIRPAIFFFVLAESLSISFLPLFAKELYRPLLSLSEEVSLGLPISAFMLLTAISMPAGGAWAEIVGTRKAFMTGAVISTVGLFLTASADSIPWLILFRAIAGLGFGMVFMATQVYIVNSTGDENRAEGMAIFLSAFYGGTLCGCAIGGLLAERIGYRAVFVTSAATAALSVAFLLFVPNSADRKKRPFHFSVIRKALPSPRQTLRLFADRNFAALTLLQSIPNKVCLIGFVYYLAPLFFKFLGSSSSDTGRYIMGYSLIMILFSQGASRLSDRHGKAKWYVLLGGVLSGAALLPSSFFQGPLPVAAGIVLLGFAHSLSVSNQAKMATQLKSVQREGVGSGLGIYRQAERIGNIVAPVVLGMLVASAGYALSLAVIGVYTAMSSILFGFIYSEKHET